VTLLPAAPDSGVVFRRADLDGALVPARIAYAKKLVRCSGLETDDATIRTCEHLLAALYACSIDNALIDMDAEEVPILDGSARLLVEAVRRAGSVEQAAPRRRIVVSEPMESRDGERFVRLEPAEDLSVDLSLTLRRFGVLTWSGPLDRETVAREICPARTFSPLRHALPVKLFSLLTGTSVARGASLNNLLVYALGRVWNPGGLRFEDELPRHRVLDILGDLMLAGAEVVGRITAFRSSHSLNQDLVRVLVDQASVS